MLLTVYCLFIKKIRRGQGAPVFVEGGRLCHGTMAQWPVQAGLCSRLRPDVRDRQTYVRQTDVRQHYRL